MKTHYLPFIVATLVAGCAVPGERADDGACPKDEVCSPDTPQGLKFSGPAMFDSFGGGPSPIAAGGAQHIHVEDARASKGALDDFDAATTGSFTIGEVAPPSVTVVATAAGEGYLRILEPGTDDLYDRILLQAEDVQVVDMFPAGSSWTDPEHAPDGWSVFSGEPVSLGVRLHGQVDRLVDQSMTIDVAGGTAVTPEEPRWDSVEVVPDASGKLTVTLKLGSGATHDWVYPISEKVEKIVRITTVLSPDESSNVPPGEDRYFCFRALDGDLAIAGVPWTFEAPADVELSPMGSCVSVKSNVTGPRVLTVKAGDAELKLDFQIGAGAGQKVMKPSSSLASARERLLNLAPPSATPGERLRELTVSPR